MMREVKGITMEESLVGSERNHAAPSLVGFWRRLAAFAMDWIILGLIGNVLGQLLFDPLASLGGGGRVVGFAIAIAYFGLLDSGRLGGRTPGKRVMGLRVVDREGRMIALPRSLLRAAILSAPFVFNGMILVMSSATPAERAFGGLMGGWVMAALYVAAFNRATRQGIHDLATGSFVVHGAASPDSLQRVSLWRPHALVAALFIVVGVPAAMAGYPVFLTFAPQVTVESSRPPQGDSPEVRAAWVNFSTATDSPRTCKSVTVLLSGAGINDVSVARRMAGTLTARAHCRIGAKLFVRLLYGFELGFATSRRYSDHVLDERGFAPQP